MSKSSFLINKILDKSNIAIVCILAMMIGFVCSPYLCSVGVIFFGINAIRDINPKFWLTQKWWLLGVLWILGYAITWFWSEDKVYWNLKLQIKLPFLLLPLAFHFLPNFTEKQKQFITFSLGLILLCGAFYSLNFFINDVNYYMSQYRYSHLLPTPAGNDHIRFSFVIALYIIWAWLILPKMDNKLMKYMTILCISILFIYMHILAAKSGLISIYIFMFSWCIYYTISTKKITGILFAVGLILIISLSIKFIPTLKERYDYMNFSLLMFKNGDKSGNYGDISRLMSYKVAINIIKQHPFTGVGTGDMLKEMKLGYEQKYPQVTEDNRLLPHNQFLVVGLGCGIPAMIFFIIWFIYPLFQISKNKESFYFVIIWCLMLIQLMIEPLFEVQFGVFSFLFFLLMFWKTLPHKTNSLVK